ncbi:MAG: hypothetical protein OHK0019_20900 [Saprospiraceae bacterium]
MTQERFHRLLDNPDLLTTIPYEEMKTLALAYPFAHNLRYLLALKARQDEHPDADRMLATAAVYSLDRTKLFHLAGVKIPVFQPVAIVEEMAILELKPIEIVQRELEALAPQTRAEKTEAPHAWENLSPETNASEVSELQISSTFEKADLSDKQLFTPKNQYLPFALWIADFQPPVLKIPTPPPPESNPEQPPEEKHPSTLSAQELAERSVSENKDVISETLARLLAKQGYRDKAIDMYERLRLTFPEKSAYFAAEIEKLKK